MLNSMKQIICPHISKIKSKIRCFHDETRCRFMDFMDKCRNIHRIINFFIRLVFILSFLFFGFSAEDIYHDIRNKLFVLSYSYFLDNWLFFALGFSTFFSWLIKSHSTDKENQLKRIYDVLKWLYEDIGFNNQYWTKYDIRCTIWTPIKSNTELEKMRILQLTDYVPSYSNRDDETSYDEIRKNKSKGRIRKVVRKQKNVLKPIGIIGKCITESISSREGKIVTAEIPVGNSTISFLKTKMNYSESEAKRITGDRKSYCGFTLMNDAQTDILGVLYLDSNSNNVFSESVIQRVEKYLPRIARILVD